MIAPSFSSPMDHFSGNLHQFHEYVEALEEERRKIGAFKRELPFCFSIVSHAIEVCRKRQLSGSFVDNNGVAAQSDCSEVTTSDCPLLEQFIPINRSSSVDEEERSSASDVDEKPSTKQDWLRSVRLWNQNSDPSSTDEGDGALPAAVEISAGEKHDNAGITGGGGHSARRKARRCWSPELHRCFLIALQQLGGAHVATPKQIRELMNVEGLTNDEVKSHLQKFRLHGKRPSSSSSLPSTDTNRGSHTTSTQLVTWSHCGEWGEASSDGVCKSAKRRRPLYPILEPRFHLDSHGGEPARPKLYTSHLL